MGTFSRFWGESFLPFGTFQTFQTFGTFGPAGNRKTVCTARPKMAGAYGSPYDEYEVMVKLSPLSQLRSSARVGASEAGILRRTVTAR